MSTRENPFGPVKAEPEKYVSSPLGPLLVGGLLLVAVVLFSTMITDPSAANGKAAFFPIMLVVLPAIPIIIGLFLIGPRRRYVATTTPEQRKMHKAEARRARRLPAAGEPLDYGDRTDLSRPDTDTSATERHQR